MSGPAGGGVTCRRPRRGDQLSVAAWVVPGRPEHVAGTRRWAQAVAAAWGAAAADADLVVSELMTNALVHTRSGQRGGTVIVLMAGGWDAVTVHVHDMGASGQVPRPHSADDGGGGLPDGGRGLAIVAVIGAEWGTIPAAWCPLWGPGDPAANAGGCCTWCRLEAERYDHDGKDGGNG